MFMPSSDVSIDQVILLNVCVSALTANDGRPDTADYELRRIQNGSPTPSLALTDTDFGGHGEPESGRSTLLRFIVHLFI
jgi:hypothetical protein